MRHEFSTEWARFKATTVAPGQKASLSFELTDEHFPYRMQGSLTNARSFHLFGQTKEASVNVELVRDGAGVGTAMMTNGEGLITPPQQAGKAGSYDSRGKFELRMDSTAWDDLWIVIDWSVPS